MASDPMQNTFRGVPILWQALNIINSFSATDENALARMRDLWPYCNILDPNDCTNKDLSCGGVDLAQLYEERAFLPPEIQINPILAILGQENQRTDCYEDTVICVWFEAGDCYGDWGCISNECRTALGEAIHATAYNHFYDDYSCHRILNDKSLGNIIPFEGMGDHWEYGPNYTEDIILRQGPIDWVLCDTGERRHGHFDYSRSLSLQSYVTETEWRDEHYDKEDPRWESICWDGCPDESPWGCEGPCEEHLNNWVKWNEYGVTSLNMRDMAKYWVERFTGEHPPNIYYLGPVFHALFDASEPQHSSGYMGNFHNLWETTISSMLDEDFTSYGTFDDNLGLSSTCIDYYHANNWTECAVLWAGEYLRAIYSIYPYSSNCYDLWGRINKLIELVSNEAREEYQRITPILKNHFVSKADNLCQRTTEPRGANHADFDPNNLFPYEFAWDDDSNIAKCRAKPDGSDWVTIYNPTPDENFDIMLSYPIRSELFTEIDRLISASLAAIYLVAQYFDCEGIDGDRDGIVADVCEGSPDQNDTDDDDIPDGCDLCPERDPADFGQDRNTDWNTNPANDSDGDGIGNNCDNCPGISNSNQANCNKYYEDKYGLENLGDLCDPDPCPSLCSDTDPLAPEGKCEVDNHHGLVHQDSMMYETDTTFSDEYTLYHYDTSSQTRLEAEQIYWCSCYDTENHKWFNDDKCMEKNCPENGQRYLNTNLKTGWYEVVRKDTLVTRPPENPFPCQDPNLYPDTVCPCDTNPDGCLSLPPCSPTLEGSDADILTCEFRGSLPKMDSTFGPFDPVRGRSDLLVEDEMLLYLRGIKYPEGTPEPGPLGFYNRLKFWIRPLNERILNVYNEDTYLPPDELSRNPDPNRNQDWNNEYTSYQDIRYFLSIPIGSAHIGGLSDGDNMGRLRDWIEEGGPPEAKDRIVIPDLWYKIDGHCPPWLQNLCFFDVIPSESALLGITFIEFDSYSRIFWNIFPSRSLNGEVPGEKGISMTMLRLPSYQVAGNELGEVFIFAFGGENAIGELSSNLWMARKMGGGVSGEEAYYWQKISTEGESPSTRKDSVMFTDPTSTRMYLFGGIGEDGFLGDLWALEREGEIGVYMESVDNPQTFNWKWRRVEARGIIPSPRSEVLVSVDGKDVVFYGGRTPSGRSGEVFIFKPINETFLKLESQDGFSILRERASIEYDSSKKSLYLYGGEDSNGLHNDLWKFDIGSKVWSQIFPDCTSGVCPPFAEDSVIIKDNVTGKITLLPGQISAGKDVYYIADKYRWIGQAEKEGVERVSDCNGDGEPEEGYGVLCSTGSSWWSVPGMMVCDTFTESLVCSSKTTTGSEIAQINLPSSTSFDIRGNILLVTRANRLESYDISNPSSPVSLSSLTLPGRARYVKLWGGYAFTASDRRVFIVDASNPASLYVISEIQTCGQSKSIAISGKYLAVTSSGGIGLIDISIPSNPQGLGMLWVMEAGPFIWTHESTMQECESLSEGEQSFIDALFFLSNFGKNLESTKGYLFATSVKRLMSFGIKEGEIPVLVDDIYYRRNIEDMRIYGSYAYLNLSSNRSILVNISNPGDIEEVGVHDISTWVKGLKIVGDRAYILDRNRLKIARIEPSWGWIW